MICWLSSKILLFMGVSAVCFAFCCCIFVVFVFAGVLRWPSCFLHVNLICHPNFRVCACAMDTTERYTFRVMV